MSRVSVISEIIDQSFQLVQMLNVEMHQLAFNNALNSLKKSIYSE